MRVPDLKLVYNLYDFSSYGTPDAIIGWWDCNGKVFAWHCRDGSIVYAVDLI